MWTRQHRRSPLRHFVFPIMAVGVLAYFSYHAINGSLGLESMRNYEEDVAQLQGQLGALEKQRATLERKTAMLRDGSLERDMLDEQARRVLGVTRENEIVILR